MCVELKHLQEKMGITFIHVTHNQEEAMTVADRIALVANGELVEHGRARDIYEAPQKRFTASFVGESNLLTGRVTDVAGETMTVDVAGTSIAVLKRGHDVQTGQKVDLSIRSELVKLSPVDVDGGAPDGHGMTGTG
jgi:ABC-type Fe3+/spermidine/putrescine transport system ATPase subunit